MAVKRWEIRGLDLILTCDENSDDPVSRVADLEHALSDIRGIVLGNGPKDHRESLNAINEIVGWSLYGDFEDSKWVRRHRDGGIG